MNLNKCLTMLMAILGMSTATRAQSLFDEAEWSPRQTVFHLNAPTKGAPGVTLRIYDDGEGGAPVQAVRMRKDGTDRWKATVKGNLKGKFYTFDIGLNLGETPGVAAKAVGVNGNRAAIIDLKDTQPEGWDGDRRPPLKSPADLVVYEMHVRDFTHALPGIAHPDKFLGVAEPAAIARLKALGVNAVHLLPSFDFASVDETITDNPPYNWGYDPKNCNVPEGSYATNPRDPATRIREFKQMVLALHRAGIRVILDVVYNHTYNIEGSNFQRTYPDYYYRKTADGRYSDGSGCGNETASERPLMRRFMLESVRYWAEEYHIDGFRFDLMAVHDTETMNAIRRELDRVDPSLFVYGEGWSAGSCAWPEEKRALKAHVGQMPGIAAFSDELRDALRGPFDDDHKGAFLAGVAGSEESVKAGVVGMIAHPQVDYRKVNYAKEPWAAEPTQMMAYVSCHDDMCLTDRLRAELPGITDEELVHLDLLAQTAVLTSQGVPFILAGEEVLRDKQGVHNSFESPIAINRIDWSRRAFFPQVFDYYRGLIALRKAHPAFRMGSAEQVRKHLEFLPSADGLVAFVLKNHAGGDEWNNIYVVLNANREPREVTVPEGRYTIVAGNGKIAPGGLRDARGPRIVADGQSATIFHD